MVGDFNQFACAASEAVAESPGMTKYNPLYIYGKTGLGNNTALVVVDRLHNHGCQRIRDIDQQMASLSQHRSREVHRVFDKLD